MGDGDGSESANGTAYTDGRSVKARRRAGSYLVLSDVHQVLSLSKLVDGLKDGIRVTLKLARSRLEMLEQGRLPSVAVEDGALDGLGGCGWAGRLGGRRRHVEGREREMR
jgi:hypothetical protein